MTTPAWHAARLQQEEWVEVPAFHWATLPLHVCLSLLSSVCLFALPNYPLGTIKIDWTQLCSLWMSDRPSVAGETVSLYENLLTLQLSAPLSLWVCQPVCLPPMAPSSECRSAGFPFTPLLSACLCRCMSVSLFVHIFSGISSFSAFSPAHHPVYMAGSAHI